MHGLLRSIVRPLRSPVRQMAVAGWLPASVRKAMPYSWCDGPFSLTLEDVELQYFGRSDDSMTHILFWTGLNRWEVETTKPFLKLLREASCFVDIGANSGVFSLLAMAANPTCQVVAVEPVPRVFQFLVGNLELNGMRGARCKAVEGAIAPVDGDVEFFLPEDTTSGSLTSGAIANLEGRRFKVRGWRGETLLAEYTPDLMKIDVEGYEPEVLASMESTLVRSRPKIILECNPGGPWDELWAFFAKLDYRLYHFSPTGQQPCFEKQELDWEYRNYLAVPVEKIGQSGGSMGSRAITVT